MKKGFTLVELLTVLVITSTLMAISLSAFRAVRERAKSVRCRANIRQLGVAFASYGTDNGSFPCGFKDSIDPLPGGHVGDLAYDRQGWWWFNYLGSYYVKSAQGPTIVTCPAKRLDNFRLMGNILCGNYGVNQSICKSAFGSPSRREFVGPPLKQHEIRHPGQTLLLLDAGYALVNWWHASDHPPQPLNPLFVEDTAYVPGLSINTTRELLSGQEGDAVSGRHPGRTVNMGFADGHVEVRKSETVQVEKAGDDFRNRKPLWLPR